MLVPYVCLPAAAAVSYKRDIPHIPAQIAFLNWTEHTWQIAPFPTAYKLKIVTSSYIRTLFSRVWLCVSHAVRWHMLSHHTCACSNALFILYEFHPLAWFIYCILYWTAARRRRARARVFPPREEWRQFKLHQFKLLPRRDVRSRSFRGNTLLLWQIV